MVQVHADHVPIAPDGVLEFQGRTALLLDVRRFDPLIELEGRTEDEERQLRYHALTAGTYYRLHRNLKVGAFYRLQRGVRHDDDWIDLNPGWAWRDTRSRSEQVLIADLSPRFLLDFLPGSTLFYEHEPYLSVLYHVNRNVKLELTGAYKTVTWSTSGDAADSWESGYEVEYRAFVLGFGVLFPFSL